MKTNRKLKMIIFYVISIQSIHVWHLSGLIFFCKRYIKVVLYFNRCLSLLGTIFTLFYISIKILISFILRQLLDICICPSYASQQYYNWISVVYAHSTSLSSIYTTENIEQYPVGKLLVSRPIEMNHDVLHLRVTLCNTDI